MAEHSPIGWTDATWPIVAGCEYESPGCSNCWAVRDSWRLAHNPHLVVSSAFTGTVRKTDAGALVWTGLVRPLPQRLVWPLKWRKARKIFVCSQSDLFHPKVPFDFIAAAFGVMAMANWHTFQVLTKHPRRALEFFHWLNEQQGGALETCLWLSRRMVGPAVADPLTPYVDKLPAWPLENVWFGVTIEDQTRAEERLPLLLRMPVAVRWISAEPMLEALDLETIPVPPSYLGDIDWVVCGGESAQTRANTRPFDTGWARDLLLQCRNAKVAFFMKQLGTVPITQRGALATTPFLPAGKSSRYKWDEPEHWPEDLRVQEFPA